MDWYYAIGTERKGPLSEGEFQQLVQQGVITPQTLVWRQGFADWRPYGGSATPAPAVDAPGVNVTCTGCGGSFSRNDVIPLAEGMYCAACKPLALQRLKEGVHPSTVAEGIRKEHLRHEASVQSVGLLYYLGGVSVFCIGAFTLFMGFSDSRALGPIVAAVFLLALGVGQFWVGTGLRRLQRWVLVPTGVLSCIGLLGFPLGTVINAYVLYLIFSQKGKTVFSDEYAAVIRQTPHIKYRTSIVVWILLGLLLLLFGIGMVGVIFARR